MKAARELAAAACIAEQRTVGLDGPMWDRAAMEYRFFAPDNRRRDTANLIQACKPYVDGIVDANLIVDDSWQHLSVTGATVTIRRDSPGVELVVMKL